MTCNPLVLRRRIMHLENLCDEQSRSTHADGDGLDWDASTGNQDTSSSYVESSEENEDGETESHVQRLAGLRNLELPPFTSNDPPLSQKEVSKKRKAGDPDARSLHFKRVKGAVNNDYRRLLNNDIQDAIWQTVHEEHDDIPPSQIGSTLWSCAEKALFFSTLCRLGRSDILGIASRIGTKSPLEIQHYLSLLQQGMVEKNLDEPRQQLLSLPDFPSAFQISPECCEALERAADALSLRQEQYEERAEKLKWKDYWLLTSDINKWVEDQLRQEDGEIIVKSLLPAADLLNLGNCLELSRLIFMNPKAPYEDENWRCFAEEGEEPSIRATAFDDFRGLAVAITKKLVSTTIFCAESRLRAMDPRSFSRKDLVKSIDVEAAVRTLGLETNSWRFWRGCPRRCHLEVFDDSSPKSYLDYDAVESLLEKNEVRMSAHFDKSAALSDDEGSDDENGGGDWGRDGSFVETPEKSPEPLPTPVLDENSDSATMDETGRQAQSLAAIYLEAQRSEYGMPIDPSDSEVQNPHTQQQRVLKRLRDRMATEYAQEDYAEALDLKASLIEEQRLWDMLRQEPPFTVKPEEVDLPPHPMQNRKEGSDLDDWRGKLTYLSSWEAMTKNRTGAMNQRSI